MRTHVGTFKHNDGVNKLQAEFSRNFQAFMEGMLRLWIPSRYLITPCIFTAMQAGRILGIKETDAGALLGEDLSQGMYSPRPSLAWQKMRAGHLSNTGHVCCVCCWEKNVEGQHTSALASAQALHIVCAGLEELYKGAVSSSMETREELDGLLNLINRLDFHKGFAGEADYHELLGHQPLPSRVSL